MAIDTTGNVWIANGGNNSLTELSIAGANVSGSPFSGGGLNAPSAIAFDGFGNLWIANSGSSAVSEFSSSGSALSSSGYSVSGLASGVVGVGVNPK